MQSLPHLAAALTLLLGSSRAAAQAIHTFSGTLPGDRLGWSLAGLGDLDGDGVPDLALGVPFAPAGSVQAGSAELRSGAHGALLRTIDGDAALDHAGWSLAALGDLDGDGRGELAVGVPDSDLASKDAGLVRVVSAATGTPLRSHLGAAPGESFGYAVASAGDVDGDGLADLLIGAWRADGQGAATGRVELRSGGSGALLRQHAGSAAGDRFGIAVAGLGDLDGDSRSDYAVGAEQDGAGPGYVCIYSGLSGSLLRTHIGSASGDALGAALAGLGDVDGDQRPDYAIGAPRALAAAGAVRIVSGASGVLLRTLQGSGPGVELGRALAGGLDLDGDNSADVLVGAPLDAGGKGAAHVFAGATGTLLSTWTGSAGGDRFGQAVAAVGDLDQNGDPDLALGSPREDLAAIDAGVARIFSGAHLCLPVTYCTAKPNSRGCMPSVSWDGSPTLSGPDDFVVRATQVLSKKPGVMFYAHAPSALPVLGGWLCVAPPLLRSPPLFSAGNPPPEDCSGILSFALTHAFFAAKGWSAGTTVCAQFWSRDPAHPDGTGVSLSDALRFVVCP